MLTNDRTSAGQSRVKRLLILLMLVSLLAGNIQPLIQTASAAENGMIRVHLTRLGSVSSLTMNTTCDYYVNGDKGEKIPSGSKISIGKSGSALTISVNGGSKRSMGANLTLNRARTGKYGIQFTSPSQKNLFCGDLQLSISSGSIKPVLNIFIEDYLYGVVGYEMSDEYALEALKAQAVAARNFAISKKKNTGTHDVTDNTSSQMFKGLDAGLTNIIKAVDQTRGVTAVYEGKYAALYYADSNGGQIDTTKNIWGNVLGYSVMKDDPYDLENPKSRVKSLEVVRKPTGDRPLNGKLNSDLVSAMADELKREGLKTGEVNVTILEVKAITPHTPKYPEPSRAFTKMRFSLLISGVSTSSGKKVTPKEPIEVDLLTYGKLKDRYSLAHQSADVEIWSVVDKDDTFSIEARRWGHGIGLSQCGAQWMAKKYGKDYKEILHFYYTGIQLKGVSFQDTTMATGGAITPEPVDPEGEGTGPVTDPAEVATYRRLKPGASGEDVKRLQARLKELGYFTGEVLGNYLEKTQTAVKRFQKSYKLTTTSICEAELQILLYRVSAPRYGSAPQALQLKIKLSEDIQSIPMRNSAKSGAKIIKRLKNGTQVRVLSISGNWCKIADSGASGYVLTKYIHFG